MSETRQEKDANGDRGRRVGVVLGSDRATKTVRFLGFGHYVGYREPSPDEIPGWTNPCIHLDNGDEVWGFETWWGDAEVVQRNLDRWASDGWTVETVRIADYRREGVAAAWIEASDGGRA